METKKEEYAIIPSLKFGEWIKIFRIVAESPEEAIQEFQGYAQCRSNTMYFIYRTSFEEFATMKREDFSYIQEFLGDEDV